MKAFHTGVVCVALVALTAAAFVWYQSHALVDAQESTKGAKPVTQSEVPQSSTGKPGSSTEERFPTHFVDDVIAKLKKGADDLIEKKLTKNSDELRKTLERTEFAVQLSVRSTKELPPQELYRKATESVFLVAGLTKPTEKDASWKTSFSTAFVVHENGILSTSAHVFDHHDQDDAVVVMDVKENVYPVIEILAADRLADTCLFRIGAKGLKPLPLGSDMPPGTPLRVIGHPGDSFFFFSAGHLANYERDDEGLTWLNVTADFGQGSSGGPVMDEAGNVIGQVSRTFTLYAAGESSNRRRRPVRAANDAESKEKQKEKEEAADESSKKADPQMIFKACTPVSKIRALVK